MDIRDIEVGKTYIMTCRDDEGRIIEIEDNGTEVKVVSVDKSRAWPVKALHERTGMVMLLDAAEIDEVEAVGNVTNSVIHEVKFCIEGIDDGGTAKIVDAEETQQLRAILENAGYSVLVTEVTTEVRTVTRDL